MASTKGLESVLASPISDDELVPLVLLQEISNWVVAVGLSDICVELLTKGLGEAKNLVKAVSDHTPSWQHIVSDGLYSKARAATAIIDFPHVGGLTEDSVELYKIVCDLAALKNKWQVHDMLEQDDAWAVDYRLAESTYTAARQFLTIRACCNTVQRMKGKPQVDAAVQLLEKKAELPDSIVKALDTCIKQNGGLRRGGGNLNRDSALLDVGECPPPKRSRNTSAQNSSQSAVV